MPKVILFNGPPRVGKDTCEDFLLEKHPDIFCKQKFAEPLKNALHKLLGLDIADFDSYDDEKGAPHDDFFGHIPRQDYIALAERFAKVYYGPEHFGNVWLRRYFFNKNVAQDFWPDAGKIVVVGDCGFEEEVQPLIRTFGPDDIWLIRLYMRGRDYSEDSRGYIKNILPNGNEMEIVNIFGKPEKMLQQLEYLLTSRGLYTNWYNK